MLLLFLRPFTVSLPDSAFQLVDKSLKALNKCFIVSVLDRARDMHRLNIIIQQVNAYQEAWRPIPGPGPGAGPGPAPAPGISLDLEIGDTAGLAAVTSIDSTVINGPRSPIVLLHGAIQGGWVWNYSRPEIGAPAVSTAAIDAAEQSLP